MLHEGVRSVAPDSVSVSVKPCTVRSAIAGSVPPALGWLAAIRPNNVVLHNNSAPAAEYRAAPEFLYARGYRPFSDIGPYHLTALARMLRPVDDVAAMASMPRQARVIAADQRARADFPVERPRGLTPDALPAARLRLSRT